MKLIIINGPSGVGKSTIAAKIHKEMSLSFLLDIDEQSKFISGFCACPEERWEISIEIAKSIIRTCLSLGRDVIVDKMTYAHDVLDEYYNIAKEYGAEVVEIIMWAPKEVVLQRSENRGWEECVLMTPEKCETLWEKINEIRGDRDRALVIDSEQGIDETFTTISEHLKLNEKSQN